jgi:hypothetical protein
MKSSIPRPDVTLLSPQTGVPVLFIPGSAGSFRQVRSIAAVAARQEAAAGAAGGRFDFFTVDCNEEFTALHGQSVLEQAAFLNDAVRHLLTDVYLRPAGAFAAASSRVSQPLTGGSVQRWQCVRGYRRRPPCM